MGIAGALQLDTGGFSTVLFFAAMANSGMASYRQLQTPDHLMARVATLCSSS